MSLFSKRLGDTLSLLHRFSNLKEIYDLTSKSFSFRKQQYDKGCLILFRHPFTSNAI